MSQENRQTELLEQTKRLLQGSLKHVRAAGLAVALVPLAAVAINAGSSDPCPSGGICGFVWQDTNGNGIQDAGEPRIEGAVVTLVGDGGYSIATDVDGVYYFPLATGTYQIDVQIPPGTQLSPSNVPPDDTVDSDGVSDGLGNSVAVVTISQETNGNHTDFGFFVPSVAPPPGTGTPGYWKTHPEAWPVPGITIGGTLYSREQAIAWLENVGKDKTTTMFSSLVSAKLNVLVGNDSSCVASTIALADAWMHTYPVGSKVAASSLAWKIGEPWHRQMDNYNNGMLCAPHRD